jgi:hypothetical protein
MSDFSSEICKQEEANLTQEERQSEKDFVSKETESSWAQWLTPVILATCEARIRRILGQGQQTPGGGARLSSQGA